MTCNILFAQYPHKNYLMTEAGWLCNILSPPLFFGHKRQICLNSETTSNHSESPDQIHSRTDQPWNRSKRSSTVLDLHWTYWSIADNLWKLWSPATTQLRWQNAVPCGTTVNDVTQRKKYLSHHINFLKISVQLSPIIRHSPQEPILWNLKTHKYRVQVSGLCQTLTLCKNWDESHGFFLMTRHSVLGLEPNKHWSLWDRLRMT